MLLSPGNREAAFTFRLFTRHFVVDIFGSFLKRYRFSAEKWLKQGIPVEVQVEKYDTYIPYTPVWIRYDD